MHRTLSRPGWTCVKCLRNQIRHNTSAATAALLPDRNTLDGVYLTSSQRASTDVECLRNVFNNQGFWNDFSSRAKTSTGIIGNKQLTTPRGFYKFAETSVQRCKRLVERTLAASTSEEYQRIPRDLDRLSDLLCRVIDLSDFIRSIHPDTNMAAAATASYTMMFQYMNQLNTTTGLNQQLAKAMSMPEVSSKWTEEEKMVAQILQKDFAKSGISLPAAQRDQFVTLSNEIAEVGTEFMSRMEHAKSHITAGKAQLDGMDPTYIQNMSSWKKVQIPVYSSASKLVMSTAHNADIRKSLYVAERTASKQTIDKLESLILKRAKLAKLTGHQSYGHMTLADKMSKTPDSAMKFLQSLNQHNKGLISQEVSRLLEVKRGKDPSATQIESWEYPYLTTRLLHFGANKLQRTSKSRLRESRNAYFALGHVIQGLSSLFESLYGVRLVPQETRIGEVWHPDVRRLDVYTEENQHIATMYCDLFSRPGKLPNPAHFTLVCSREIADEEIEECQQEGSPINDGMTTYTSINSSTGKVSYNQTPIIALVCDFNDRTSATEPTLLTPQSLTTLFHEMGHAVHSILGRTTMQGIAGTRCATDFAELPSVLMEYFATNPSVLRTFAKHWQTGADIPEEMMDTLHREQQERAERSGGWDNEGQILMAILDQVYHSCEPVEALQRGAYDSTAAFHRVWQQYGTVQEPMSTAWQGFFGHLYGYGATYYSYLFDRAIARQVWRTVFRDGRNNAAIDRAAGERFKNEVLRWGGGRDPWKCLEGLIGEGKGILAEGGDAAMDLVGGWGVGAGQEGQM